MQRTVKVPICGRLGAFSLVELVVVLAIILILAALIFPSLIAAKGKSRVTACISNLRQLGLKSQIDGSQLSISCPYPTVNRGYVTTPEMPRETAGATWAYCTEHLAYAGGGIAVPLDGNFVVLYGPTSTRIVKASQVKRYQRTGGTWTEIPETGTVPDGVYERWRFPGEPWPPEN